MCHSLLDQLMCTTLSTSGLSACVNAEGAHFEHTYDCYSQNNSVEMAAL